MSTYWPITSGVQIAPFPAPEDEPVQVADVVRHLKWPPGTPDEIDVPRWITASRQAIERDLGIALAPQTWDFYFDAGTVPGWVQLPLAPVEAIEVSTVNDAGEATAIDASTYTLVDGRPARVVFYSAPTVPARALGAIQIRALFGYADPKAVPADLVQAVLYNCAQFALHRGDDLERTDERQVEHARQWTDRYLRPGP